jgi:hypothetical protein
MTVYILVREDQNEHGYIDTSIAGIFLDESVAKEQEALERQRARIEGLLVEDDDTFEADWQVSWKIEEHVVNQTSTSAAIQR